MLYMIGYDLRRPQYYSALGRGVRSVANRVKPKGGGRGHASACNVRFGPWLVSSDASRKEILAALEEELRKEDYRRQGKTPYRKELGFFDDKHQLGRFNDKLMVVPLGNNPSYKVRSPNPRIEAWFRENRVKRSPETSGDHVLAISYTLIGGDAEFNRDVRTHIWKSFSPDCANPLYALWFVRTGKTARETSHELGREAGNARRRCKARLEMRRDELLELPRIEARLLKEESRLEAQEPKLESKELKALESKLRAVRKKLQQVRRALRTQPSRLKEVRRKLRDLDFALLVVEVEQGVPLTGLDRVRRDPVWLWQHGVNASHVSLEEADPRAA